MRVTDLTSRTRVTVIKKVRRLHIQWTVNIKRVLLLQSEEVLRVAPVGVLTAQWIQYKIATVCLVLSIAFLPTGKFTGWPLRQIRNQVLLYRYLDRSLLFSQVVELRLRAFPHFKNPLLRRKELLFLNA